MINWIECNLPYSYYEDFLSKDFCEKYKCTTNDFYEMDEELKLKFDLQKDQFFTPEEVSIINTCNKKWLHMYGVDLASKYKKIFDEWFHSQEEYISYCKRQAECHEAEAKHREEYRSNFKSFTMNCPNKPGILFQLASGRYHLIGTINVTGTEESCQDCFDYIDPKEIVVRYAQVLDMDSLD